MTFSSTVLWDQRLKLWNTMPRRERMRSTWRAIGRPTAVPFRRRTMRDRFAADRDLAGVRRLQHVDAAQQRGLARAGGAEDRDDVALVARRAKCLSGPR